MTEAPASEVSTRLAGNIAGLVQVLLPAGRREGEEWRVGSIHGDPGGSLGVHVVGAKAGYWKDFGSADRGGDALGLVRPCGSTCPTQSHGHCAGLEMRRHPFHLLQSDRQMPIPIDGGALGKPRGHHSNADQ